MNHKRHRPKNARAGCLMCKPHKANGADHRAWSTVRRDIADRVDYGLRFNAHRGFPGS